MREPCCPVPELSGCCTNVTSEASLTYHAGGELADFQDSGVSWDGVVHLNVSHGLTNNTHPIPDSFQFGGNLHSRSYETKIASFWLIESESPQTDFFKLDIHPVQAGIVLNDRSVTANVAIGKIPGCAFDLNREDLSHLNKHCSQIRKLLPKPLVGVLHD